MSNLVIKELQKSESGEMEVSYKCIYCDKLFVDDTKAYECVKNHELVYLPISKNDLNRLNQFIFTGNNKLLTESLVKVIQKYARQIVRNG